MIIFPNLSFHMIIFPNLSFNMIIFPNLSFNMTIFPNLSFQMIIYDYCTYIRGCGLTDSIIFSSKEEASNNSNLIALTEKSFDPP